MKVSTKWLNDYVKVDDLAVEELAEKIERTAVEVDETYRLEEGLKKIVVGKTLEVVKHPDSDHLNICQVDVGEDEPIQIICGAPNIAANQKVIVALSGARIAGNVKIKRGKMRGQVSNGMICALQEIGFSESVVPKEYADGIYVLPESAVPGEPVYNYLGMDEDIIDVDVTPNRGDMLSMRGVARDVAAVYGRELTLPMGTVNEDDGLHIKDYLSVKADKELAPAYKLRVIDNVTVKPSPMWLQKRLWNAGVRPINNVVDVTNYILMDYGQPLHAFDYNKINSKELVVRLAEQGEKITTLDDQERELQSGDIVITNGKDPIALAGVMGGANTEVGDNTTTVVLESAMFDSSSIRKTSRRENLHSEASMRFERGINRGTIEEALDYAANLIAELGDGKVATGIAQEQDINVQDTTVEISLEKINNVLGTDLSVVDVTDIFERLGFKVEENAGEFVVNVPPFRWDISIPADLIEEVARIYGYDNIPATLPVGPTTPGHYTYEQQVIRNTRAILEASGLTQAISYGLTTKVKAERFAFEPAMKSTELDFPMSSDHTTVRMNLISGLLDDVSYNKARKVENVALYEQGRVFFRDEDSERPREVEHVAAAMTGLIEDATWHDKKRPVDFYVIKGIVQNLLDKVGVGSRVVYTATAEHEEMHPGRTANIYIDGEFIGFVGEVHPTLAKEYNLDRVYVFELDLQKVMELSKDPEVYEPVSKFPAIKRDIALLVAEDIQNSDIIKTIKENGGANLASVNIFDVYAGEKIDLGFKSLAYTLTFENKERTLTDDEVNKAFDKVVNKLQENYKAVIR